MRYAFLIVIIFCWPAYAGVGNWNCTIRSASGSATSYSSTDLTVSCTGNEKVRSGGCWNAYSGTGNHPNFKIQGGVSATGQGWTCGAYNGVGASYTMTVYASCCL